MTVVLAICRPGSRLPTGHLLRLRCEDQIRRRLWPERAPVRTSLILLLACALGASGMSGAQPTETPQAAAARVIVGYLPSYRLEHFPPRQLDIGGAADRMTHLVYAFGDVTNGLPTFHDEQMAFSRLFTADESVDNQTDIAGPTPALRGALNQLRKLKARHPHLAVLMSLGGSSRDNASGFSLAARTDASRQAFVSACLDLFI